MKPVSSLQFIILMLFLFVATAFVGQKVKLVILHTNDTHSQVEPTEKSVLKLSDMGGYGRIMGEVNLVRKQEKNVLLLDAGDFSQGTPYFNFFNGRVEVEAFNRMQYDAITLGNHEFDNGIDTLAVVLKSARFPVVSSNYKFPNLPLSARVKPYLIVHKGGLKIGIMAINVDPKGLIIEKNYKGMLYKDALTTAIEMSTFLKTEKKCDLIICLSHIGANVTAAGPNDYEIARKTSCIDVIIGGHSHTLLENVAVENAVGKKVVIAQMGKSGLYLGRVELELGR